MSHSHKSYQKSEIDRFFTRKKFPRILWLVMGVSFVLLVTMILITINFELARLKNIFTVDNLKYWIGVFGGVLTSIIATYLYEQFQNQQSDERLKYLERLAPVDLLKTIFNDLLRLKNRYYLSYRIATSMDKSDLPDCFNLKINYKFSRTVFKKHLQFEFFRIRNSKDRDEFNFLQNNLDFLDHCLLLPIDETDYESTLLVDSSFYSITEDIKLSVNSSNIVKIDLQRREMGNRIVYEHTLNEGDFSPGDVIEFSFEIQIKLESESFIHYVIDLPVKNEIDITFNYEKVEKLVYVGASEYSNSSLAAAYFNRGKDCSISFLRKGWILSKNSYSFIWWKK